MATQKQRDKAEENRLAGLKKTEKVVLQPVVGSEEDLGLGAGLDLDLSIDTSSDAPEEKAEEAAPLLEIGEVDTESPEFLAAVNRVAAEMRKGEPKHEPAVDEDLTATTGAGGKEGRIAIMIDEVEGMSNYEVVGVNGKVYQIQRGVKTMVPVSVVHALENAIATRTIQTTDRVTGELVSTPRDYSAIPWRKV